MNHDTASEPTSAAGAPMRDTLEHLLVNLPAEAATPSRSRGRPVSLSAWHLSLAVLVCLLRGLQSQAEVWRLIAFFGVGHLPALPLSDQAVYDRLEQDGVSAFAAFFSQLSACTAYRFELVAAGVSSDLAYTVGYEHISVSMDGVPVEPFTLRVTHVYRHKNGEWKIVHRHADYPPIDQSPSTEAPTR